MPDVTGGCYPNLITRLARANGVPRFSRPHRNVSLQVDIKTMNRVLVSISSSFVMWHKGNACGVLVRRARAGGVPCQGGSGIIDIFATLASNQNQKRYGTIQDDLEKLVDSDSLESAVCLFHNPPYKTCLDGAALDEVH